MSLAAPASPPNAAAVWLGAMRPKTLWAAVAPVVIGGAMAWAGGVAHAGAFACALLGAVLIQVGTNFYNDYADAEKGADTDQRKGPTRAVAAGHVTPNAMLLATALAFLAAVLAGGFLMWRGGWPIVAVGVASIAFGLLYTAGRYSLAYLGIADLFVLVFFGPVAVAGTYYVQALDLPLAPVLAGLGPGFLSVAILLVNNIRDVDEDRDAGKRTLIVRLGRDAGVALYIACLIGAAVTALGLALGMPAHRWVALAALVPLGGIPIAQRLRSETDARALNPLLGKTARLLLLYSVLFSITWML